MKTPQSFVAALADAEFPSVFNPYRDHCPEHDLPNAAVVRSSNLVNYLEAARSGRAEAMWIARDLGYRGGRRTGIPLTDEAHLAAASRPMGGIDLARATQGPVATEATSGVVWQMLANVKAPVVPWNVFPFHPHPAGNTMKTRCHTGAESAATVPLMLAMIAMIQPRRLVAIGCDASRALTRLGLPHTAVRHPSYGGRTSFIAGIQSLHGSPAP